MDPVKREAIGKELLEYVASNMGWNYNAEFEVQWDAPSG